MNSSNSYDLQSKVILERIQQTEKNAKLITESIGKVNRKESKSRDKYDDLARVFDLISTSENHNDTTKIAFENLSLALTHIADIKELQCTRIEDKIINEFSAYEIHCRNAKEEIKSLTSTRNDITKRRNSDLNKKMRQGFIESDLMASNVQINKISKELQTIGETFEKQKVGDFKEILLHFILIQMKFFTSGLEVLADAYKNVQAIDASKDLEQFKKHLAQHEGIHRHGQHVTFGKALSILSQSASNLDRLGRRAKSAIRTRTTRKGQSSMSLDSLSSNSSNDHVTTGGEIRKESKVIEVQLTENEDDSTSDESEDTDLEDTDTDDLTDTYERVNRVEHAI